LPLLKQPRPLVSIVTPCFNSAEFIERTIESVLSQDYPEIEYIVQDGASTDGTVAILERYSSRLRFESARDEGVADAINKGFEQSTGQIVAWLNADDEYLPGAVANAVRRFAENPDVAVVYGEGTWVDEHGGTIGRYPTAAPYRPEMLQHECGICQPATFMRRTALESVGWLDRSLNFAFDYDLWIRLSADHRFAAVPDMMALSRMHRQNKTLGKRKQVFQENIAILRSHYGYVPVSWVYGYLSFLRDGRDQFFEPLEDSAAVYAAALLVGSFYNPRSLFGYWREWASRLTPANALKLRRRHRV
jgi:glycosyltransferase involved in cell wall biosynthesis